MQASVATVIAAAGAGKGRGLGRALPRRSLGPYPTRGGSIPSFFA